MKKGILKRVLSLVLAIAMVFTMSSVSQIGQVIAKADEVTYKLYFELPEGTTCADWCVNSWSGVTVSGNSEVTFRPTPWGEGDVFPTLLADGVLDNWGYVEITGNISGLQFVNADGYEYNCWNSAIASNGVTTAYFAPGADGQGIWYTEPEKTNEITLPEVKDIFYLKGNITGTDWDTSSENGLMTQSEENPNVFSVTFTNVKKGNYEYKILQDPKAWGWDKYFGENTNNRTVSVSKLANVTFTIDTTDETKACDVSFEYVDVTTDSQRTIADQVQLVVDEDAYDMNIYYGGVYEVPVTLAAGEHTALVKVNGAVCGNTATVTVDDEKTVYFRFAENTLTDSVNNAGNYHTAALVGSFDGVSFTEPISNWDPANKNAELDYIGGGIFARTFEFEQLTADTSIEYKVAFDDKWDYSLGVDGSVGGSNVALTIPAGATKLTIFADEINHKLYDSVNVENLLSRVTLAGSMNGWGDSVNDKANDFTPVSDTLYVHQVKLASGHHEYKCIFGGSEWLGGGNIGLDVEADDTVVTILYDKNTGKLFDSINDSQQAAILLGLAEAPAEMKTVTNKNGTTKFVATGNKGDDINLFYAPKADAESDGADAFTKVELGKIETNSVSSGNIFFGDAAVDVVYYYEINGVRTLDASNETVNVGGVEYSNYTRDAFTGRDVYVPGTFPGNSWDPASNKMEYQGNGLYTHTFENVAAQNYEYKIAFGTWSENYGVGGAQDGSNYGVTVPEKQDVTIYYQDITTHLSVTSLNYVFADAYIKGTDVAKTALKDDGLTGIYSAKVHMAAGTYSDVKLYSKAADSEKTEEFNFNEFTVDEDKDITFYFAPQYGIYYNDATPWGSSDTQIKYDTKDKAYKSVYGAVATGEDVTFQVATDDNVTAVKLFVKLNDTKQYDLEKVEGENKWATTVSFDEIGEYDYFFVIYSGSAVKVYCDDDAKDYGEGKLTDLNHVIPYDLVVYKDGYKTPDWMKNAVIYQIFPDRFNNGNTKNDDAQVSARGETDYELVDWSLYPENPEQEELLTAEEYAAANGFAGDRVWNNEIYGGDFKGIIDRIDYLKALGVNVIYLNPVFASISSHRYDATDYGVMDPILGGDGDFKKLVNVAKKNGMKIVLDGVFNHVSDDSIYFDRYYKFLTADDFDGKIGAYPYWAYVYDYMAENDASQATAEDVAKNYFEKNYNVTDFSYTTWFEVYTSTLKDDNGDAVTDGIGLRSGKPVYGYEGWWGYDSMPVIKATTGSEYQTTDWAKEIIGNSKKNNGSIAQYWLSKGSNGWRLDVANEVSDETWQNFRESVKAMGSDNVIIGEIWDDATEYLEGDMYDSVMNYVFRGAVLSYAKGGKASDSMATLERIRERYPEEAFYAMMNLVDSHDTTRVLSYLDGIDDDRNQKEVDKALPTYEKTSDTAKQKQYLVALLQFTYAGAPTVYYGDEIGMVGSDDPDDRRAFEWGQGNEQLVKYYATLAKIRSKYSALRTGSVVPVETDNENVLGYVRSDDKDTLVVLTNNSNDAIEYTLDLASAGLEGGTYTDLISGNTYKAAEDATLLVVTIPANSGIILTQNAKKISINEKALAPAFDSAYILKSDLSAAGLSAKLDQDTFVCDGKRKTPAVSDVAYRGIALVEGKDYTVSYSNNVKAGTAYVKITGKGAYKGTGKIAFTIKEGPKAQKITGVKDSYKKTYGDKDFNLNAKAQTKLSYSSSNKKVVTVDEKGKVSIKGAGTATIVISAAESEDYKAATKKVTVTVAKANQSIKTEVSNQLYLSFLLRFAGGAFDINAHAKTNVTYSVTKGSEYVSVNKNGMVTVKKGTKRGTYEVTVTAAESGNYNKATKVIKIFVL